MAKTQIHEQKQALSVYFDDMLAEPKPKKKSASVKAEPVEPSTTAFEITEPQNASDAVCTNATITREKHDNYRLLLCQIDEIKLAIPVSGLNNIVHWPQQELNQLPTQADWQLGLFKQQQYNSQIIDIRYLLGNENLSESFKPNYILFIDERRWGIACQQINQVVSYQHDDIDWSSDLSQRPWLTGCVNESRYQIVDIPALLAALEQRQLA